MRVTFGDDEAHGAGGIENRNGLDSAVLPKEVRALRQRQRVRQNAPDASSASSGGRDEHVVDVDDLFAGDGYLVRQQQLVHPGNRPGDRILDRNDRIGGAAVRHRFEGLFQRGAGHQPGVRPQKRLSRFFAVRARRALVGGIGVRFIDVELLHSVDDMIDRRDIRSRPKTFMKRGLGLVVVLVGLAVVVSAVATLALYFLFAPAARVADASTLVLRPGGELYEIVPDDVLQFVARSEAHTVRGYVEALRKAKVDPRITAVLLAPRPFGSPFWAKVQELREAILDFKTSGKPVYAFLEYGGDREYYLASAADKIFLVPTATLDLTGVATYEVFLRGTLDWIGTYPDLMHIGDYKTAVNVFTEESFTPAHREMTTSLNSDQFQQLVRAVADGRRKSEADVRVAIDEGPLLPEHALRHGLVDDLAYEDELDDLVGDVGAPGTLKLIESDTYARVSWESLGVQRRHRIAVLNAVGAITGGKSHHDPVNGAVLGSDSVVDYIRRIRGDSSIKAIVLRIDSPGGSSTASDVIWRELMITKNGSNGLPIVVSMSDLAASGGYYIAMAGDVIVAQPGTLTGSIGIYSGKFVTGGSFEKVGANIESVSQGRHAEIYSPDRRFTPEERAKVQETMQAFYDQFVEKVAEARHMTPEKIDSIGQGRVWTGLQAKEVGLVDELGGMHVALAAAKQRARIPAEDEVELVIYPPRRSFYEVLTESLEQPAAGQPAALSAADALATLLGPRDRKVLAAILAPSRLFRPGEILAHMPYVFLR